MEKTTYWLKIVFLIGWSLVNLASGRYLYSRFRVYVGEDYFILKDMGVMLIILGLLGLIYTYLEYAKKK